MNEWLGEHGTFRVCIDRIFALNSVGIWLVRRQMIDGAPATVVAQPVELEWETHEEGTMLPNRPSLLLPADAGRVLLDELAGYYGGTGEARTLRRDYDAERARVDKLIGHLIGATR